MWKLLFQTSSQLIELTNVFYQLWFSICKMRMQAGRTGSFCKTSELLDSNRGSNRAKFSVESPNDQAKYLVYFFL